MRDGIEYKRKSVTPAENRTHWKIANTCVETTPNVDIRSFERKIESHMNQVKEGSSSLQNTRSTHLTLSGAIMKTDGGHKKKKRKISNDSKCAAKIGIEEGLLYEGGVKQNRLIDECKRHGLAYYGTLKLLVTRLQNHYKETQHSTRRVTGTNTLMSFLTLKRETSSSSSSS